jgi:hypothetical protein
MSHWIVNFFMTLMNIFSLDENFPEYDDLTDACNTSSSVRTAEMKQTMRKAHVYFYVCPGSLDALPAEFLNQVDGVFEKVFSNAVVASVPFDSAGWRKATTAYTNGICDLLNEYIARPGAEVVPVPLRASSRMRYYLQKLSGTMYIPTATALLKTAELLLSVGLGVCEVSTQCMC